MSFISQILRLKNPFGNNLDKIYSADFFNHIDSLEEPSANDFVSVIINEFAPKSVIDIGCGNGIYMKEFIKNSIKTIGIDGSIHSQNTHHVKKNLIKILDLTKPIDFHKRYDLALCVEVAEHLPKDKADILVKNIIRHSATVVFTAAHPGQGGVDHLNEQPPEYWISIFQKFNYLYNSLKTNKIKKLLARKKVIYWIADNLMIFEKIK